ncbi:MAG: glycoside hydrolase family 38 C-terminal domain-containing protein, partial [Candidatus Thorarchaeota archaeon]
LHLKEPYPTGFLKTAWKWHLRNQPHDSICGCSVDQTHDEMKARYSWAETIANSVIDETAKSIQNQASQSDESHILVFNATNNSTIPTYLELSIPDDIMVRGFETPGGAIHETYSLSSKDDIFFEVTLGVRAAKLALKMMPGRKLMDHYMNGVEYCDGDEPGLLEIQIEVGKQPIGEFDIRDLKVQADELFATKKYKKIHVIASRPTQNKIAAVLPLAGWAFTKLKLVNHIDVTRTKEWTVTKNSVANEFYNIDFNKDGTLTLFNKELQLKYENLHTFEDWGDRGDEYTFGRLGPEKVRVKAVKRTITISNPLFAEIRQEMKLELFESLDESRQKRTGKSITVVESTFRFYRDLPRIEVTTKLTNTSRDHRLRICFDMPFSTKHTRTSTHFGCVTREGAPEVVPEESVMKAKHCSYHEQPSGIQAQKRYVRVDEEDGSNAFTLFNMGLPEIELVDGSRLAMTLLRSVGWLSRSDFPERPILAGPGKETPGAQELRTNYDFRYGFITHSSSEPIHYSADHADSFANMTSSIPFILLKPPVDITKPIIQIDNPWIRISSVRVRGDSVILTLYNLSEYTQAGPISLSEKLTDCSQVRIDGSIKENIAIYENRLQLEFNPFEIKMLRFE